METPQKCHQIRLAFNYWHATKSIFCAARLKEYLQPVKIPVKKCQKNPIQTRLAASPC